MNGRLAAAFENVNAIKTAVFATYSTKIILFLGPCNVYWKLTKYFSKIARLFNNCLRKQKIGLVEPYDWGIKYL